MLAIQNGIHIETRGRKIAIQSIVKSLSNTWGLLGSSQDKMTLLFPSMEPDVSFSPTDLTQKESMGADTSIAADAEARSLYVDRYPRD